MNAIDLKNVRRYVIGEEEVRRLQIKMIVDTGAYMMAINETIQQQLNLSFVEHRKVRLANDTIGGFDVVGTVRVHFANRTAICNAFVLPFDSEPVFGAILMGELDVLIHPQTQELVVNPDHPDGAEYRM